MIEQEASSCTVSARRFKRDIKNLDHGLDWVLAMQPVSFIYKNSGQISLGFVADDLGEIDHRLAAYNKDGSVQTARYDLIAAVNTKAIQEQQSEIEQLKAEIRALRAALKERVLN